METEEEDSNRTRARIFQPPRLGVSRRAIKHGNIAKTPIWGGYSIK